MRCVHDQIQKWWCEIVGAQIAGSQAQTVDSQTVDSNEVSA